VRGSSRRRCAVQSAAAEAPRETGLPEESCIGAQLLLMLVHSSVNSAWQSG
jgi:hypothetical protein